MAQIIKHRRGSIDTLVSATAKKGELIIATGSVGNMSGPWVFVGETEGSAGAFRGLSKIYQGAAVPNLTVGTWGSTLNGTPFYSSNDKTLYILSNAGNTDIDLTGNIEGNTISGLTINKLTGDLRLAGDLYMTGNTYQTGSHYLTGDVILSGSINIGDNVTGDTINFNGEVNSNILPTTGATFDLGSSGKTWNNIFAENAYLTNLEIDNITLNSLSLPGNLTVSGTTTLSGSVYVEDLIEKRLVVAGAGGLLTNYSGLTFNNGNLNVSGAIEVTNIQGTGSLFLRPDLNNSRLFEIYNTAPSDIHIKGNAPWSFFGDDTNFLKIDDNTNTITIDSLSGVTVNTTLDIKGDTTLTGSLFATKIEGTGSLYLQPNQSDGRYFEIYNTAATDTHIKSNQGLSFFGDDTNFLKIDDSAQTVTIDSTNGIFLDSNTKVNGTLIVTGTTSLQNTLTVTGTTIIHGNETVNGILTVTGNTQLGGNLYVSGTLEVLGSSTEVHIQSNTVEINDNIILLNAYSPFERYAGIALYDSGSTGESGSFLWDSLNNYFLMNNNSVSSKVIGTTTNTLGNENSLTSTYFPISTGDNTIGNSLLRYSGTTLSFNTNKFTVDSSSGNVYVDGNVRVNGAGGSNYTGYTSEIVFKNSDDDLGFVSSTDTQTVTTQLLGYQSSDGTLVFSSLIDGGSY